DAPDDTDIQEASAAPHPVEGEASAEGDEPPKTGPVLTDLRFEPDGSFALFGRDTPGSVVSVQVDGREVEQLQTGSDGVFFYLGLLGFSDVARVVSVIGDPGGAALPADRTFVLAANPAPVVVAEAVADPVDLVQDAGDAPDVAEADGGGAAPSEDTADTGRVVAADAGAAPPSAPEPSHAASVPTATEAQAPDAGDAPQPQADVGAPPQAPASPAILALTDDGVDVVQPAISDRSPEVMSNVALDTITYAPDGDVVLGGRALGEGFVQVYVNNAPVSRLTIEDDGTWRGDLPDVDKGVYTLRIDEVDAEGDVVSRIETPFLREDPDTVAQVLADEVDNPDFTVATRTVQPGATLWAIAEERYGAGVLYVTVFEANRDRIRNPDLIYPGQVFVLPQDSN
ncbi:LysM peptidoglycan-binding domain-containing protein, partial [Pseudooctadecabacter sp.]|uniref:LysM peptidoglycan-binding domain-containing protein n=1 Tax=Pseudooctadecabacter sp. TaxID=1966338 RepID=UPI0025F0DB3F